MKSINPSKVLRFLVLATLSVILVSGCDFGSSNNGNNTSEEYNGTIKVGHLVALDMAPLFVAKELGFFAEQGLEVETIFFSNPGDNNAALAGGNIQFSVNPFTLPFLGDHSGVPMRIISSAGGLGVIEVVAQGQLGVDSIEGLKKRVESGEKKIRVGSLKGDTLDMILYKAFLDQGMNYNDFEMVWFNDLLAMVQSFQTGQIDVLSHIKPYTTDLVVNYDAVSLIDNSEVWGYGTPNCTAAVLQPFLTKYPITVEKYLRSVQKAFEYIVDNPDEAAELLARGKYYQVDLDVLKFAFNNQPKEAMLLPNVEGMFIALNDMVSQGYIETPNQEVIQTEILKSLVNEE